MNSSSSSSSIETKLRDTSHPVTQMLVQIHELKQTGIFKSNSDDPSGALSDHDRFVRTLVRALYASQTEEHYEAIYAMWDDAPFRDVARMMIRTIHNLIMANYKIPSSVVVVA